MKADLFERLARPHEGQRTATAFGDTFKSRHRRGGNVGAVSLSAGLVRHHRTAQARYASARSADVIRAHARMLTMHRQARGWAIRAIRHLSPAEAGGTGNVKFTFRHPDVEGSECRNVGIDVDGDFKDVKLPINEQLRLTGGVFNMKLDAKAHEGARRRASERRADGLHLDGRFHRRRCRWARAST